MEHCGLNTECCFCCFQAQRPSPISTSQTVHTRVNIKKGLKPIIENLKEQGLLIPCNSPYNTPILCVKMLNDKWRLVQDLWIRNEAVVPLHPMVHNPYNWLSKIPEGAKYFSLTDFKVAF